MASKQDQVSQRECDEQAIRRVRKLYPDVAFGSAEKKHFAGFLRSLPKKHRACKPSRGSIIRMPEMGVRGDPATTVAAAPPMRS
jgi:hypothetical protein